jgi:hypothetical protein
MQPFPTTWVSVDPGMYVQGTDGSVWRVDDKKWFPGRGEWHFSLASPDGRVAAFAAEPERPATVLIPTMEEAEQVVTARLGVTGIQRRILPMEHLRTHPDTAGRRSMLAAHLLHIHGVSASPSTPGDDIEGLLETHALSHARPETVMIPHVHTDQL